MRTEEPEPPLFMFGYVISRHGIIISFGICTIQHTSVITMADSRAWEKSVAEHLKGEAPSAVTISKVPERLRRGKNDGYEPRIISFGPYHHGKQNLQAMEKYKRSFLEVILSFRPQIPRERYIEAIKALEEKIRTCYTDYFDIGSEQFVEMILNDGCFLVGYFLQFYYQFSDELARIVGMDDLIRYDILLLENQLPFFILIMIFDLLQFTPTSRPSSFKDLAINYLINWVAREKKADFQPPESVHHLLHLYHSHCLYTPVSTNSATVLHEVDSISVPINGEESDTIHRPQPPSATVLYEAGVKFVKNGVKGSSILDVKFNIANGKMMIPPLVIDSFTKSSLRNLVAFEQFYPDFDMRGKSFTAYVEFMDFIVNTPADVALLHKKGIIRHFLGSDKKAANFLNDLIQGVSVHPNHYLADLYKAVDAYQGKKRPKWRAMLMHNYCNSPWAVLGIVAGGFLLVLTLVQTIFSGYSAF